MHGSGARDPSARQRPRASATIRQTACGDAHGAAPTQPFDGSCSASSIGCGARPGDAATTPCPADAPGRCMPVAEARACATPGTCRCGARRAWVATLQERPALTKETAGRNSGRLASGGFRCASPQHRQAEPVNDFETCFRSV